jgi:hypothetical protein
MRTRDKDGFAQPVDRLNLHVVPMSPLPRSVCDALSDPNWCSAMQAEFDALIANNTCCLVPRPLGVNLVTGKWIYYRKLLADGYLIVIRLAGFCGGSHSGLVLIMMRLSVLW